MAHVTLLVSGMTCEHCRDKVDRALNGVSGVWGAAVDLEQDTADIDFDDRRAKAEQFVEAVRHAGYEVQVQG